MKKSIGPDKVKTAVFISGTGSNLKNLIKFSSKKNSPISINLVISNNKNAKGLKYAKQQKIEKKTFNFIKQKESEKKIIRLLTKKKITFICLAGFMKILSNNFLKKFNGKAVNIHPSLLPKYKGLDTHKRVLKNNEKFSGCTVHYVTTKLDSGKIILQKKIKISKADKENTLRKKILREEHKLYPRAIKKIFN
ncbi:MAG TPA: phosphoribosylglycinamide formyltransferase [Candidatus Pelagibacter bacterium]|jgi:phosphoribosylglycinamide formyltransferase-1|nr:phosphoribosylglycinamide formyltransferase [Pelagibacteraceae bacterium]HJN84160.1 phosphoribosylglycinamide formyltransferase [Candidatus Pelagibacter bacterium]|tara:strand:- start:637 stop:1215 length:579 start_codon:yes stop_codon:yes gene_type:complete